MKLLVLGLAAVASLGLVGCDETAPVGATASRKSASTAPVADVTGRWEMDPEGFVEENWELLSLSVRKGVEPFKKERERIATLRVAERAIAEQALQAKIDALPTDKRDGIRAALGSIDDLKAWVRTTVASKLSATSVAFEFSPGGGCKVVLALPGKDREEAKGRWTQQGERVTIKTATVNGKAAKGKDTQPVTVIVRGAKLTYAPTPGAPKIVARRSA